jgi:hypothetical protein
VVRNRTHEQRDSQGCAEEAHTVEGLFQRVELPEAICPVFLALSSDPSMLLPRIHQFDPQEISDEQYPRLARHPYGGANQSLCDAVGHLDLAKCERHRLLGGSLHQSRASGIAACPDGSAGQGENGKIEMGQHGMTLKHE